MAYDEGIAFRLRELFASRDEVEERRMFGGLAFMVGGHMCVGIIGEQLMARVGPDRYEEALRQPHARPMDLTGKPMKGFVLVDPEGYEDDDALAGWVDRGLAHIATLPPR